MTRLITSRALVILAAAYRQPTRAEKTQIVEASND